MNKKIKRKNLNSILYKLLRKNACNNSYGKCLYILFLFFSFSVFSNHEEHCELLMSWEVPVCGPTAEERTYKVNILSEQLAASLERKRALPKKVIKAGKTVFNIGTEKAFRDYSGNPEQDFRGGSGFFMFDDRTFFSAHHVLGALLNEISDWDEVVFKDQNGNTYDLKIKGVKFLSKLHDIVIFEIEGYDGPVLELSQEPPQNQSYVIGYPEGFKIQSVINPFETTNHYAAFIELFDCYYGYDFIGASGGPLVNKEGKVEGVFGAGVETPLPTNCGFTLAKKLDFLSEGIQMEVHDSIEKVKELMNSEENKLIADNDLIRHLRILATIEKRKMKAIDTGVTEKLEGKDSMIDEIMRFIDNKADEFFVSIIDLIAAAESQQWLSVTSYEMGVAAYHIDDNLTEACHFWNKARQTGHPFVLSDSVIIPNLDIVRCEF